MFSSPGGPIFPPSRLLAALAALSLASGTVPLVGYAQTVEPRYESLPAGAVTTIYPDESALGARDVVELLQWYVPGAIIIRDSRGRVEISLRGGQVSLHGREHQNPLLIIDGVQVSNASFSSQLQSLDPFRVERIEVLRDVASTVMYGMKASEGVILVFTRRR